MGTVSLNTGEREGESAHEVKESERESEAVLGEAASGRVNNR